MGNLNETPVVELPDYVVVRQVKARRKIADHFVRSTFCFESVKKLMRAASQGFKGLKGRLKK